MCDKCSDDAEYCGELPVKFDKCCSNCKPAKAVIQTAVVETTDGLKQLCNVVVRVMENNTIYYVDDKHRIMEVFADAVTRDNYDFENNPEKFVGQFVVDYATNTFAFYDTTGKLFYVQRNYHGTTSNRPNWLANDYQSIGFMYFDTDLGKPVWWNGTGWVDATGASV